ncbi:hypothetical protein RhiJN_10854 [Ceratobasidium sp. AG-Ba]|nr:hypothetical protein RhiJN_10854 [Ceratobasidium sp. AG-Ba]QRW11588.1 hypothetical protein RhiLY_10587 [Ceratobasidium sp. AG-Ba]
MSRVITERKNVQVGQRIWGRVVLDAAPLKDEVLTAPRSTTMQRIVDGQPVDKMCYVVEVKSDCLLVNYATTFGKKNLEDMVKNINDWVKTPDGKGWIFIGDTYEVFEDPVGPLNVFESRGYAHPILELMMISLPN